MSITTNISDHDILWGIGYILTGLNPLHDTKGAGAWAVSEYWWGEIPAGLGQQYVQAVHIWHTQMIPKIAIIKSDNDPVNQLCRAAALWWRPNDTPIITAERRIAAKYWLQIKQSYNWLIYSVVGAALLIFVARRC